ncbi:MAG: hypothetical protein FWE37_02875 [Spirochaetaceae bacterium]|nr:hypothetical protein [Spirochaetaceae bacterium]
MVSREPRQILGFEVGTSVNVGQIQKIVDSTYNASNYYTDGCPVYQAVDFFKGKLIQNINDKSDTYIIEGTNADIRHYVAGFRRKSRCFFRKEETLKVVLCIFIDAYNKFGEAKYNFFKERPYLNPKYYREFKFSLIDFL